MRLPLRLAVALTVVPLAAAGSVASAGTTHAPPLAALERSEAAVVRAWSARLNAGDNAGAAALFTLPAMIIQAPFVYRLPTRSAVAAWHAALPCSGTIVSITYGAEATTAVFRLGQRRGRHTCTSPGALAAARFDIVGGKIVLWEQVPVPSSAGGGNVA